MAGSLSYLGTFIRSEKAPYIVTLFVAALTWTGLRTSERLTQVPFIEFSVTRTTSDAALGQVAALRTQPPPRATTLPAATVAAVPTTGVSAPPADSASSVDASQKSGALLRLRNITPSFSFECFVVTVVPATRNDSFGAAEDQRHVYRGHVAAVMTANVTRPGVWEVQVEDAMPGADLSLFIPMEGSGLPRAMVHPCKTAGGADTKDYGKSKAPILLPKSPVTWYVENELCVLWVALGVWLLAIVGVINAGHKNATTKPVVKEESDAMDSTG